MTGLDKLHVLVNFILELRKYLLRQLAVHIFLRNHTIRLTSLQYVKQEQFLHLPPFELPFS